MEYLRPERDSYQQRGLVRQEGKGQNGCINVACLSRMRWCARPGNGRGAGVNAGGKTTGMTDAAARLSSGRCAELRGAQDGKRDGSPHGERTC